MGVPDCCWKTKVWIEQAWDHPDYDLAMEILTLLSPEPHGAPLPFICKDFGVENQGLIMPYIQRLKNEFGVVVRNGGKQDGFPRGVRLVALPREPVLQARAREAAEAYLDRVYAYGMVPAQV